MSRIARGSLLMVAVAGVWGEMAVTPTQAQMFTKVAISAETQSTRGITWGDYDNDGYLDMYLARVLPGPNLLYRNNRDGTFVEVGEAAGVSDAGPGNGTVGSWGDYDNDGDLDLYLVNTIAKGVEGVNKLYQNNGNGTFVEVGASARVDATGDSRSAIWGDYDNDGDLDLYVTDYIGTDHLYRNNGDGLFTDIGVSVGVSGDALGRGSAWGDYDNDGDLDLYMANTLSANFLYRNKGDGIFTEVAVSAGVDDVNGTGVGPAWGDYDSDGDLDLYVTNQDTFNRLYQNNGDGTFKEVGASAGVDSQEGHALAWGDYDNDGDLDLYVTTHTNLLYRNNGDGTFTEVATSLGVTVSEAFGSGASWGDYDNDGDLDLYVANIDTPNLFYRNEGNPNHWLHIKFQGTVSNRSAIGARVIAVTGDKRQTWEVEGGMGFCSQNSLPVEFGFGQTAMVDSLIIRWPSGIVQTFTNLATNQRLAIVESNPLITAVEEEEGATLPKAFSLSQNFPNPFNPQTTIHYQIPEEAEIRLTILDLAGQEVRILAAGSHQPGQYRTVWNGTDTSDRAVASGVYLYQLEVVGRGVTETKRMALVR